MSIRRFFAVLLFTFAFVLSTASAAVPTPTPSADATLAARVSTPEMTPEATDITKAPVDMLKPEVISTRPHDTTSYTEGLFLYNGDLYESGGEYGQSTLQREDPKTGQVLQKITLPEQYFGEGIALVDDRLIQLTYKEQTAFVYDRKTFKQLKTFTYDGPGWGLCYDPEGKQIWMSNGTDTLVTRDPDTFAVTHQYKVTFQGYTLDKVATSDGVPFSQIFSQINELECVGDTIYSNVYLTNYILRIDKKTGAITGIIDASNLLTPEESAKLTYGEVLNGIAYDPEADTFLITGKHWPKLFEVRWSLVSQMSLMK